MQSNVHRLTQGCQYRFIVHPWNRLVEANEVYLGSRKSWIKTFIDFILPVARRFYSPHRGGMGTIMNLLTPVLHKLLYVSTMIELFGYYLVTQNTCSINAVTSSACSYKFLRESIRRKWVINDFVWLFGCLIVCLLVCLLDCLFVCLFVCLFNCWCNTGVTPCAVKCT